jgi:hypothetical protein
MTHHQIVARRRRLAPVQTALIEALFVLRDFAVIALFVAAMLVVCAHLTGRL